MIWHGGRGIRHALESHPFHSAGQAKRQAHLPRGSKLDGGSASRQPRGEQSLRSRPECPPVPVGGQSKRRSQELWRRQTCGIGAPRRTRLAVCVGALVLGVPQLGHQLPEPGRHAPFSCCRASLISTDNALSRPCARQQREAGRGPRGGNEPPVAAWTRRHPHRTCRRHGAQKRASSKATFLSST
jgi:hypothetical protein